MNPKEQKTNDRNSSHMLLNGSMALRLLTKVIASLVCIRKALEPIAGYLKVSLSISVLSS